MSLKKLSQFNKFDANAFFNGKGLLLTKIEDWLEYSESDEKTKVIGTKLTGVIYTDGTTYREGQTRINQGETLVVKIKKPSSDFSSWKMFQTKFQPTNFEKAVVYGDYRNQLSLVASAIRVLK